MTGDPDDYEAYRILRNRCVKEIAV